MPQNRERIYIIGFQKNVDFKFPTSNKTTLLSDVIDSTIPINTLSKTLEFNIDFHLQNRKDFLKIKELALKDKQIKAIAKWTDEKIKETYIKINTDYKSCEFVNNWAKK